MGEPLIVVHGQQLALSRWGGAGRYALELQRRFEAGAARALLPDGVEVRLLRFAGPPDRAGRPSIRQRARRAAAEWLPPRLYRGLQAGRTALRRALDGASPAVEEPWPPPRVLHELTNYSACREIGRWSLSRDLRLCVTFLDLQDRFYPEFFTDAELARRRLHYEFYRNRADGFLAISEFTKATMVERLGIAAERIAVTPLAPMDGEHIPVGPAAEAWAAGFGRYLLYPARAWRHKNHEFLLRVLARRRAELARARVRLLLVGPSNASETSRLGQLVRAHGVSGLVEILGFQSDERLLALLRRAEWLVFPSLFEGFGMPVLDAMAAGCPVLCSRAGALPEIAGDAAVYFDPRDEESLLEVLDGVLGGTLDREAPIRRGRANVRRFTWARTLQATVEQYRALL